MFMKLTTLIGSAILLVAFGIATPAYAQEQHDQDHPAKPEDAKPEDKPKQQAEPAKTPNDEPRPTEREAKPPKEEPKPEQPKTAQPSRQAQQDDKDRAKTQQDAAHKQTTQQHGRIPDDKFRANFGREHTFHVGHPQIVSGRPRFAYGGYSFYISEAWPNGWGYDDDVYIIEVNGVYYLVDNAHPGVQLALVIE
jgi:hypothetical protein